MSVYVDQLRRYDDEQIAPGARRYGPWWSHLTADSDDELHQFAKRMGMRPTWAQDMAHPLQEHRHYDLTAAKHSLALQLGAVPITQMHFGHLLGEAAEIEY